MLAWGEIRGEVASAYALWAFVELGVLGVLATSNQVPPSTGQAASAEMCTCADSLTALACAPATFVPWCGHGG